MAIYMYVISSGEETFSQGLYIGPFTKVSVDKSVFMAFWILPISLVIGLLLYYFKINKMFASAIVLVITGILSYPFITDGRMFFIKEAFRLQIRMRWWLQWITSKENYYGLITSHSMWLDFARDYGMVVLGLLLVFEVWSIYCFIRMLRNGRKSLVDYVLIVAFVLFNF